MGARAGGHRVRTRDVVMIVIIVIIIIIVAIITVAIIIFAIIIVAIIIFAIINTGHAGLRSLPRPSVHGNNKNGMDSIHAKL